MPKDFDHQAPVHAFMVLLSVGEQAHENQSRCDTSCCDVLRHDCYSRRPQPTSALPTPAVNPKAGLGSRAMVRSGNLNFECPRLLLAVSTGTKMASIRGVGPPMEVLRKSIEQLSAPICQSCAVEMTWYRSILRAPEQVIAHAFACPRCGSAAETTTPVKLSGESRAREAPKPKPPRSQGAFKLVEEYASGLRDIIEKWRRRLH